jgi:ubiquinone/menaquinone biosynthesis C-methylase UbiE
MAEDLYDYPELYHKSYSKTFGRLALNRIGLTNITAEDTVLCVGAGTGLVASWIERNHNSTVYSLEPHPAMRQKCAEVVDGSVISGSIEDIPLQDDTATVTVCSGGVISYANPLSDAISEVVRVTKTGGRIGLSGFQPNFTTDTEYQYIDSQTEVNIKWESQDDTDKAIVSFTYAGSQFEDQLVTQTEVTEVPKEDILREFRNHETGSPTVVSDRNLIWGINVIC